MTPVLAFVAVAPVRKATTIEEVRAAKAVAAFELAWWRKNHPKADLSVTFNDPAVTPAQAALVRAAQGYKNPIPVLDLHVLTIVYDLTEVPAPKRLGMDAFVFLGSFPKGFHARYLILDDGKTTRVLTRTVLDRYAVEPTKT